MRSRTARASLRSPFPCFLAHSASFSFRATRTAAQERCDALKNAPGALESACQLFQASEVPEVRFWCLQTLEELLNYKYAALNESERVGLRHWLVLVACQGGGVGSAAPFLANKLAQVYALLMRQEYPEQWPDAMQALLRNLEAGEDVVWMFIRVLRAVDVEIINVECHRGPADAGVAMRVKDAMRAQCTSTLPQTASTIRQTASCLTTQSTWWYHRSCLQRAVRSVGLPSL